MARPITCESLDGNPAAYMITDLSDGTTFAVCVEHWADLCGNVAASQRPDADTGAESGEVEAAEADDADPGTVSELAAPGVDGVNLEGDDEDDESEPCPFCGLVVRPAEQEAHVTTLHMAELANVATGQESRTRRKLASRPDSTATSEGAVPWPRVGEDPHP
jgi:hypothetical protein